MVCEPGERLWSHGPTGLRTGGGGGGPGSCAWYSVCKLGLREKLMMPSFSIPLSNPELAAAQTDGSSFRFEGTLSTMKSAWRHSSSESRPGKIGS